MISVVAALAALALSMSAGSAFAQSVDWAPMDITTKVTNVERVHGALLDEWTFSVMVTNNEARTLDIGLQVIFLASTDILVDCPPDSDYIETVKLRPGRSTTLSLCGVGYYDMEPVAIAIDGWFDPDSPDASSRHILAFERNICQYILDDMTCSLQSITRLIRDVEPESVQCEAPPPASTTNNMPNVTTAAYHTFMNDLVMSFDGTVELADVWNPKSSSACQQVPISGNIPSY